MNECAVASAWGDASFTKIGAGSNKIMIELVGRDFRL